jgi:polysaccharide export outer membrane protein
MVALVSLCTAGIGCQSNSFTEHDSFALHSGSGQSSSKLFAHPDSVATGAGPTQTVSGFTPTAASAAPAPVTLQPVPIGQAPVYRPTVIASSWQPVQRVSAEQPVFGPELNGNPPAALPPGNVQGTPARTPAGSPLQSMPPSGLFVDGNAVNDDPAAAAPPAENIVLPVPRTLGAPALAYAGPMPVHHGPGPDVPREFEKMSLPPYVVEPPDLLLIQASDNITLILQRIEGPHLVAPDGTVNLGIYGKVRVVGLTIEQVADAVAARLLEVLPGLARTFNIKEEDRQRAPSTIEGIKRELQVDVLSYNSKYYYVITDGGGYGQQVYPFLITGNETVLDALAKVNGLPAVASKKKVWVARATRAGQPPKVLPVDWRAVTQCGSAATNYQILPGDRVYVDSDKWIKTDTWLAKRLSPILRGFGATLLGASTVNTIKNGTSFGGLGAAGAVR